MGKKLQYIFMKLHSHALPREL